MADVPPNFSPPPGNVQDPAFPAGPADLLVRFINHVLGQHKWARERLQRYAGRQVEFKATPIIVRLVITPEGLVEAALRGDSHKNGSQQGFPGRLADAMILSVPLLNLPQFALDPAGAMRHVRIDGDAEFAQLLGELMREVRWDVEDDLARVVGDMPAHRIAQGASSFHAYALDASGRLADTVAAFLVDEDRTLVRRAMAEQFVRDVGELRDDCARLEKRIERLERTQ